MPWLKLICDDALCIKAKDGNVGVVVGPLTHMKTLEGMFFNFHISKEFHLLDQFEFTEQVKLPPIQSVIVATCR